ncbi:structural protein [Pseudomonas phage PaMx33]|nr:structural protein [Pseudomonas phage PaMx33]ANA49095.1 structural protein [Pseudomonas phage PaMx46]
MIQLGDLNNLSLASQYDWQTQNAVDKAAGIAVATVVDIGTSMWNSLVPESTGWEVSTQSLLQSMGAKGALQAYNENTDTVQALSFIGGMFIPGGAALKLAKGIRAGLKATNFLSSARHMEDLAKYENLIATAQTGTAEYKKLRNGMYLRGQANNLMDSVAVELSLMGAFNAHPYMEDYMENPIKNFGIGLALGGGIGGGLAAIGSRIELKGIQGLVESKALEQVRETANLFDSAFSDTSTTLANLKYSAQNLEQMTQLPNYTPLAKEMAGNMALSIRGRMGELAEKKAASDIKNLPAGEEKSAILDRLTDLRFNGVDSFGFFKPQDIGLKPTNPITTQPAPSFVKTSIVDGNPVKEFRSESFYSPDLDSFMTRAQAQQVASAADLGYSPADITKKAGRLTWKRLQNNFAELQLGERTADVEVNWLANLKYFDSLDTKRLLETELVKGDFPAIQGWLRATEKRRNEAYSKFQTAMAEGNPDANKFLEEFTRIEQAKVKLFSGDRVQLVEVQEIGTSLPVTMDGLNYVKPTHIQDISKEIDTRAIQPLLNESTEFSVARKLSADMDRYILHKAGAKSLEDVPARAQEKFIREWAGINREAMQSFVSPNAGLNPSTVAILLKWIGGKFQDKEAFRNAMASARTLRNGQDSTTPFHDELANMLNSPLVKAQQEALRRHADQAGNVYLYRGLKSDPVGDTPVSSYTFHEQVARSFQEGMADPSIFRVHVDDVVGYLYGYEREWLVGASTRDRLDALPTSTGASSKPRTNRGAPKFETLTMAQMYKQYLADKSEAIYNVVNEEALAQEVIALQYNVPLDMVPVLGSNKYAFTELAQSKGYSEAISKLDRWKDAEEIPQALAPTRRIMSLKAREDQHMGRTGELLDLQRQALVSKAALSTEVKMALNNGDTAHANLMQARLNVVDSTFADINKLWVENSIRAEKSELANSLLDNIIDSAEYKALREGLNQFVNGKGGNPFYQSADFVTSQMGDVGRLVTSIGERVTHYANEAATKYLTPVATEFRKLHTDLAARAEFANLDNLRQGTPGYVRYDIENRMLVTGTLDPKTGQMINVTPLMDTPVVSDIVHNLLEASQKAGDEIYNTQSVINRLSGRDKPASVGLWIPPASLKNKEYAYIDNLDTRQRKLIIGNNSKELEEAISLYTPGPNERIIRRSEAQLENEAMIGDDLERVYAADITRQKRGMGPATPDLSAQRLDEIIMGYRDRFLAQASGITELSSFDLMKKLDYVSEFNRRSIGNNNKTGWRKIAENFATKDTARDIKDLLLGQNPVYRSEVMRNVNNVTDSVIQGVMRTFQNAWEIAKPTKFTSTNYDKFEAARKAAGIEDPFAAFTEAARPLMYERARQQGISNPNRIIQIGNEISTTLALKFMELAQPITNMLSLPILMTSTISRAIKAGGIQTGVDALNSSSLSIMLGGVRRMNSSNPIDQRIFKMAEAEGLFSPIISEVDAVMKLSRFSAGGTAASIEKALDSKFVQIMGKPSELSETLVRKTAFATGIETARRLYGNKASDKQVLIFARDFLKQSVGNYTTSQRPMLFQGSAGAAMGLFQTYMLTYAQNLYRHLELKDYKGLGKVMLAQGGIFGAGSLPGFQPISHAIGDHFSDDNYDLTTGTFRALDDDLASILIYGLPSNLGPALHTRGDVNPRVPSSFDTMVAPSMIGQLMTSFVDVGKAVLKQDGNVGQAFFEALSTQSVSRPIARLSELASGYSVTGAGNQIAAPEDVWTWQGVLARVLSTRPLKEAKVREAIHLNTYYGSLDREQRQAVLETMKTAIRNNNLTPELMDDLALEYLRTGTPQGLRSSINQAFMENEEGKVAQLRQTFKDSPLVYLLDDLD